MLWKVSDCEELVGVTHRRWWGWFPKILLPKFISWMVTVLLHFH